MGRATRTGAAEHLTGTAQRQPARKTSAQTGAPATLLDGRKIAERIVGQVADKLAAAGNPDVTLATVLVGAHPPSRLYVNLKLKMAARGGLKTRLVELPGDVSQHTLEQTVRELAADDSVHGILLQLPLPDGVDASALIDLIPAAKDVDGLTAENLGRLLRGKPHLVPCTPLGVMRLMEQYNIPTQGRKAVVIGRSHLVGLPQVMLLALRGVDATVTLCHSKTQDMEAVCRDADILVAAAGMPELVRRSFVKPGAAVFDVGVTRRNGKITGDVAFDEVRQVAGAITPMPGGTGPMTVACLIENTLKAAGV